GVGDDLDVAHLGPRGGAQGQQGDGQGRKEKLHVKHGLHRGLKEDGGWLLGWSLVRRCTPRARATRRYMGCVMEIAVGRLYNVERIRYTGAPFRSHAGGPTGGRGRPCGHAVSGGGSRGRLPSSVPFSSGARRRAATARLSTPAQPPRCRSTGRPF